eukprot:879930-Pleurochrysis_carterae.AAC.3
MSFLKLFLHPGMQVVQLEARPVALGVETREPGTAPPARGMHLRALYIHHLGLPELAGSAAELASLLVVPLVSSLPSCCPCRPCVPPFARVESRGLPMTELIFPRKLRTGPNQAGAARVGSFISPTVSRDA